QCENHSNTNGNNKNSWPKNSSRHTGLTNMAATSNVDDSRSKENGANGSGKDRSEHGRRSAHLHPKGRDVSIDVIKTQAHGNTAVATETQPTPVVSCINPHHVYRGDDDPCCNLNDKDRLIEEHWNLFAMASERVIAQPKSEISHTSDEDNDHHHNHIHNHNHNHNHNHTRNRNANDDKPRHHHHHRRKRSHHSNDDETMSHSSVSFQNSCDTVYKKDLV
ncbi:G3E family GTPase, partial [Reticulomyxa filosa]